MSKKNNFTLVTGLWDLGRDRLKDFGRSFDHYQDRFSELLSLDMNMVIFVPKEMNKFISLNRSMVNTKIINKEREEFQSWFAWFKNVQDIRRDSNWYGQADWLQNSPQAKLEYYNPVVMSKFFMLNDVTISNPFNTEYFFWIDAGLTNTVGLDQLRNMNKLPSYMKDKKFLFLSYPYETDNEVHGFKAKEFNDFCGQKSTYVCRGGFFGGKKEIINGLNGEYYGIAANSFAKGLMGTEECFHTIMAYKFPERIHRFELEDNGLVYKFFDHLSEVSQIETSNASLIPYDKKKDVHDIKTSLYILTYNSPEQFAQVAQTWLDNGWDKCHRRILIDNSTDPTTYLKYQELCHWFYFEHIKKEENVGICGGRQFVAEHFAESDSEYMVFIEDDMFLNGPEDIGEDKFGYPKYTENLYEKSLSIIHQNRYDFLKLTYCEFYGDNSVSWAWYNVPQPVREQFFPDHPKLPEEGLGDPPLIEPTGRKRFKDLHYLEGEYHYCNWPIWVSKEGNYKIFLDTKWDRPFEQTWMSYVFQQEKRGLIKAAVLEASPITHDRFAYYPAEDRIES